MINMFVIKKHLCVLHVPTYVSVEREPSHTFMNLFIRCRGPYYQY